MLINKEVYRGDDKDIYFYLTGDYSAKSFLFVVKADKILTSSRLIQKSSSDATQMELSYDSGSNLTTITIHLLESDTSGLISTIYYYDLMNDTDNNTPFHGQLFVQLDIQTPTDSGSTATSLLTKGTTAERPTLDDSDVYLGFQYFDTTIGAPVWWDGSIWSDEA